MRGWEPWRGPRRQRAREEAGAGALARRVRPGRVHGRERVLALDGPCAARAAAELRGRVERPRQRGCAGRCHAAAQAVPVVRARARPAPGRLPGVRRLLAVIGGPVGTRPAPCAVYFWFPRGYHGRPAPLRFSEVDLGDGVYGQPRIEAGRTMTFHPSRPAYAEDAEGRLRPTSTTPSPPPALPARGAVARVARTHPRGGRGLTSRLLRGVRRPERGGRRAGSG
jgi:hypothetical protein